MRTDAAFTSTQEAARRLAAPVIALKEELKLVKSDHDYLVQAHLALVARVKELEQKIRKLEGLE